MEQVRVLMVEDNDNDAVLINRELARLTPPPAVQHVRTKPAFATALEGFAPHAILSDHNIPGFGGWEALEIAQRARPDVPFILVTGSLDEETAVRYLKGGAADYILKDRLVRLGPALLEALERARQREALREQERLLRQIIDANPSLIFVKDWNGRFVLVNQATAHVYGTTVDALVGKTDGDFNRNTEEVAHFLRDDRDVMSSGQSKIIAEEPVTNPAGETRWFQTIKVPLRSPAEGTATLLGVATEITERKRLEEQLLQSQKMEAVGQLAGGVAHDFNNILTAIVGYTDLLAAELASNVRQLEDLEEIRKAARRAAALTRQLLAFSRKQVLEPRIIDVNAVVLNLDKMLRSLISENIELKTDLADNLGAARADPNQIEQVIMNLAINARDAMPDGGTVTIETGNVTLDDAYAGQHVSVIPGEYVMLAVSDTGCGMDAKTQSRIFEPFFTTKPAGRGTGLGLSTVYGIVKQTGGNIWLYSEPGKGTTFKVYLPAIAALPEDIGKVAPAEAPRRGAGTVLVVEDDEQLRRLTHRALDAQGYTVLVADRGGTALDIARRHKGEIDLLLTDVIMPDTNGRKLAETIRAARPGMRVLYMSGYPDGAIASHGMLEPGVAYLAKPFTTEAITRRVREVLEAR
ncbi:MAG: hybrid sensor histidine kinase/response regulator [Gemmatimonadetes bacterium]|nr:MAG: hybrid sensor histidine kinase/response regulator [Gemmatimonadota bacterium]